MIEKTKETWTNAVQLQEAIKQSIEAYQHYQQAIISEIDRNGGKLHQNDFDARFRYDRSPKVTFLGNGAAILGNAKQGHLGMMIDLVQRMVLCGTLKQEGKPPNIVYSRAEEHREAA